GWLLAVAFCCVYHPLKPRLIWLTLLLGLMAITSAYVTFIACALFLTLIPLGMSIGASEGVPGLLRVQCRAAFLVAVALFAASLAFVVFATEPPDSNPDSPGWRFHELNAAGIEGAFLRLVHALLPVRDLADPNYWIANGFFWDGHPELQ